MSERRRQIEDQQKKENLERSRQNQRRSRQNKKKQLEELKAKVREFEANGVKVTKEVQISAINVLAEHVELREEILRLRQTLRRVGVSEADIEPPGAPQVLSVNRLPGPRDAATSPITPITNVSLSAAGEKLQSLLQSKALPQPTGEASEAPSSARTQDPGPNPFTNRTQQRAGANLLRVDTSSQEEGMVARGAEHSAMVTSSRSSFSDGAGPDEHHAVSQADPTPMFPLAPQHQPMYGMTPVTQYSMLSRWQGAQTYQNIPHTQPGPISISRGVPAMASLHSQTSPINNVAPSLHTLPSPIHNMVSPSAPVHNQRPPIHGAGAIYGQVPQPSTGPTLQTGIPVTRTEQHSNINYQATHGYPAGGSQHFG